MKKIIVFAMIMVLLFGLVACNTADPAQTADSDTTDETVSTGSEATTDETASEGETTDEQVVSDLVADITLWSYPRFDDQENFFDEKVLAAFNEIYPNVTVTTTTIPWDGGPEKVNTAIASGNTPDILLDGDMRGYGYADKGVLVPLNDVILENSESLSEAWQNAVLVDGNQYLATISTAGGASMLVNVALAEEYGIADMLPEDHVSWTMDEFYAFCKAATEAGQADGVYGIGMFAGSQSSDSNTMSWLMGSGTTILNANATAVALNTDAAAETLDYMAKLVQDGIAMPGASTLIDDEIIELFLSGKTVVSQYGDLWTVNEAYNRQESGDITGPMDAQYFLYPTLSGEPATCVNYGAGGFMVFDNKDEDKIAAAKAFIGFIMNSEFEAEWIENAGQLACRTGIELYTSKPEISREASRMTSFAQYQIGSWGSQLGCWSEVRSVFYPEIQAVYSGLKDGKTALDDFATNADKIIADNS